MKNFVLLFILCCFFGCSQKQAPADLIIFGGRIHTLNPSQPEAEAVAVRGSVITFIGSLKDAQLLKDEHTRLIDLAGRTMTPGLIEGHGHLLGMGYNLLQLDLMGIKSFDELIEKVKQAAAKAKPGDWILGRGWHQDKWDTKPAHMVNGFPTHELLSKVSPNNPVFLNHASGHLGLANAKAMELAGVNQLSLERRRQGSSEGGEIVRDANGNPTGIFNENAQSLIEDVVPHENEESAAKALELALKACAENGITGFHDAGIGREGLSLLKKFLKERKLTVRLYEMLAGSDPSLVKEYFEKGIEIDSSGFLTVRSVKLYADGALGTRGAWLLKPYQDQPQVSGMATQSMDNILNVSREALAHGFQVCTHAIGDRANREVLDRYETAFKENTFKSKDARFRIEHAQHIDPADIPRFGKLGVIPSMQAIHLSSDRPWAIDRLGEKRIVDGSYKWQSLLESGAKIVNGTDVPVEPINPIANFFASVTRQTLKGVPPGGYEPKERMSRTQALRSMTIDAAYGAFQEKIKGSIEVGKLADFTIYSQDLIIVPSDQILSTQVMMTVVGGKIVYERK